MELLKKCLLVMTLSVLSVLLISSCAKKTDQILGPSVSGGVACYYIDTANFPDIRAFMSTGFTDHTIGDFSVTEDDKPCVVTEVTKTDNAAEPLSVAVVIDVSSTMTTNARDTLSAAAVTNLINSMSATDSVELISAGFNAANNGNYDVYQSFTSNKVLLLSKLSQMGTVTVLGADDYTSNYDALNQAITDIKGRAGRKVIFLITDGIDNKSITVTSANSIVSKVLSFGIPLHIIGIGDVIDAENADYLNIGISTKGYYSYFTDAQIAGGNISADLAGFQTAVNSTVIVKYRSKIGKTTGANNMRLVNIAYNQGQRYCQKYYSVP